MTDDELQKMIDDHWEYVSGLSEKMYKDAFRHGYKHGKEGREK